eukprot:GHUV01005371.1.p2 GENE.GHUV01005371.1~~GHUV01005371.1.p2  ORF type:complete len:153 (+),score=29.56 GHUV01005371.1:606-1064(+)
MDRNGSSGKMMMAKEECSALPRIHKAAYAGDIYTLRQCIHDGEEINGMICLQNAHKHMVVGVTPLYLAAQAGHKECCQLLIQHGADVLRQCAIPETGDVFGPTDIALVHFNIKTWYYLNNIRKQRLSKLQSRSQLKGMHVIEPLLEQSDLMI